MEAETINTSTSSTISQNGDELSVVRFNDVELTFRTSDGFVNATKLCSLGGRHWKHYYELGVTKSFLTELSQSVAIPADVTTDLVKTNRTGRNETRGTWVHPRVAIDLAQWISPSFKVAVVTLVERYATGQVTTEESRLVAESIAGASSGRFERPSWISVEDQQEHHRLLREYGDERGVYVAKIASDKAKFGNAQRMVKERIGEHKRDFNDFHLYALVPTDDPLALEQYLAQDPLISDNRITYETFNERTKTTKLHREIIQLNPPDLTMSYIRSVLCRGLKVIKQGSSQRMTGATEIDVEMVREKEHTKRTQEEEATKREQEKTKQMAIRLEMMRLQIEPARGSTCNFLEPASLDTDPDPAEQAPHVHVLNVEQRDVSQWCPHRTLTSGDAERPGTAIRIQATHEPEPSQIVVEVDDEDEDEHESENEECDQDKDTMEVAEMEAGVFWMSSGEINAVLPAPFLSGTIQLSACKTKVSQPDFMRLIFKENQLKIWTKMLRNRPFVNRYTKFEKLPEGRTCHRYFPVASLPQILKMAMKTTIKEKSYAHEIDIFRTRHLPQLMKLFI